MKRNINIRDMFHSIFGKNTEEVKQEKKETKYYKMLNGEMPVFSNFGNNVYASDLVKICIDRVATHCSKLQPKHIRVDNETGKQTVVKSPLERLLKCMPNPFMTTSEFIYKVVTLLLLDSNVFIYPLYEDGIIKGLYPLRPMQVDLLENQYGDMYIKFYFANGYTAEMPYYKVIHLRQFFGVNEFMGDDDNKDLLKTLQTNQTMIEGIAKGIESSFQIRGILKINTVLAEDDQKEQIKEFEEKMTKSKSGILPMDLKGEYIDLKIDPKIIDKDTLDFIQNKVLNKYGVSIPIFNNKYTEEEFNSFYESRIEPISIMASQGFTARLFTERERDMGNQVEFYSSRLQYASWATKVNAIKELMPLMVFRLDDALNLLGMPPAEEGGDTRILSLNHIDARIANEYQLNKSKSMVKEENGDGQTTKIC